MFFTSLFFSQVYVGAQAIIQLQGKIPLQNSPAMDIFKQLVLSFDSEGRYHLFNAMANQLRYPNRYVRKKCCTCTIILIFRGTIRLPSDCHGSCDVPFFISAAFNLYHRYNYFLSPYHPLIPSPPILLLFFSLHLHSHTHYFSCVLLALFGEAESEAVQEQITRVLLERLIVHRPHPVSTYDCS